MSKQETESTSVNEDPKKLQSDITHLREWLKKQPHINGRTDDEFLLRFLRGCKYSLERAKEKIDTYYTMRTAVPEFFSNRDPQLPVIQEVLKKGMCLPLGRDAQGRRVALMRVEGLDLNKTPVAAFAKMHTMLAELMMEDDGDLIGRGHVAIIDLKGANMSNVTHFSPGFCKKVFMVYQDAFPIRLQGMHYLNVMPLVDTLLALFKSLLKEKIRNRINIHQNLDSLHKLIPKEALPEEYGGTMGTIQEIAECWRQKMIAKRSFFLEDEKYCVDEKKRKGKPKTHGSIFGFEGSFRQLSLD